MGYFEYSEWGGRGVWDIQVRGQKWLPPSSCGEQLELLALLIDKIDPAKRTLRNRRIKKEKVQ